MSITGETKPVSTQVKFLLDMARYFDLKAARSTEDRETQSAAQNARNCRSIAAYVVQLEIAAPNTEPSP